LISEAAGINYLISKRKYKSEDDVLSWTLFESNPPLNRDADRLSFFLASGTARVQLGTNMLKQTVDFGRY